MARILIHVEGQTEETFVRDVLAEHLLVFGHDDVGARLLGNARKRENRGGIRKWEPTRTEICRHLIEEPTCYATTMVDYYGLPKSGVGAWPGTSGTLPQSYSDIADRLEIEISKDIVASMGANFDSSRFIPFVIMHEFEGLLFSDCTKFASSMGKNHLAPKFELIRKQFSTPEEINDSPITAPSKRVLKLLPSYQKPLMGTLAVREIGLAKIREQCPIFNRWVERLESIPRYVSSMLAPNSVRFSVQLKIPVDRISEPFRGGMICSQK